MSTKPTPIKVLLVDDHAVVRQGLMMLLSAREDITVVDEAGDGKQALELVKKLRPDIVLMDLVMPVMDGIEATKQIRALGFPCAVLMLTSTVQPQQIQDAIRAGASGYVLKVTKAQDLIDSIYRVAKGQRAIDPIAADALLTDIAQQGELADLTTRELEVLRKVALGHNNSQIAERLQIGEATVRSHIANLMSKLNLRDRAHATVFALKRGLVTLEEVE
jgi:two-component system, NarL family, response regulator LiaR